MKHKILWEPKWNNSKKVEDKTIFRTWECGADLERKRGKQRAIICEGCFCCYATCHNEIGWTIGWAFKGKKVEPKIQPRA